MALELPARYWTEYEAGWGNRPDGYTVHRDEATAAKYAEDFWARERARNPSGLTPAEYTRPADRSVMVEVSQELYDEVMAVGSVWAHPSSHLDRHAKEWRKPVAA